MRDLHGESGRTMAPGEAVLRRKIKLYADALADGSAPDSDPAGIAAALRLILIGIYDPRELQRPDGGTDVQPV